VQQTSNKGQDMIPQVNILQVARSSSRDNVQGKEKRKTQENAGPMMYGDQQEGIRESDATDPGGGAGGTGKANYVN
jgi:hypothetical protein